MDEGGKILKECSSHPLHLVSKLRVHTCQ